MAKAHELGRRGEALAARELERRGWSVLAKNFRIGRNEIDLIIGRDGLTAFVEVKTRAGRGYGHPLEAITWSKRREIARVARGWIARHGRPADTYRFDAVAVLWEPGGAPTIEHVEDAWRM